MVKQRPETTDVLARIAVIEHVLSYLLAENPPPPDTREVLMARIEAYFAGRAFTGWDEATRTDAVNKAQFALLTIFRPPHW